MPITAKSGLHQVMNHLYADLSPNSGPLDGGTIVTISAQSLHHLPINEISCHFGNTIDQSSYHEVEDVLICESPAHDGSLASVLLTLGIGGLKEITSIGRVYTYYTEPTLASISPSIGYLKGNEAVKISGTGFQNYNGLGCLFGDLVNPKAVWISAT